MKEALKDFPDDMEVMGIDDENVWLIQSVELIDDSEYWGSKTIEPFILIR